MQFYFSNVEHPRFSSFFALFFHLFFEEYIFWRVLSRSPTTSTFFFIFIKILFLKATFLSAIVQDEPSCIELKDPDDLYLVNCNVHVLTYCNGTSIKVEQKSVATLSSKAPTT